MAIEYTWKIANLECAPAEDGNTNVVKTVHWRCEATDGEYAASSYGTCGLDEVTGDFVEFAELTEADVLAWCYAANVNQEEIEASLVTQIDALANPTRVSPELPW